MPGDSNDDQVVQRQITEPPEYALPHLKNIASGGQNLFTSGAVSKAFSPYPGATYIPPSEQEMQGMGSIQNLINQGNPLAAGLLGNMSGLQDIISGQNQISITQPGQANPHLMGALDQAAGKASDSVNSLFSAGGRYGGGAHQGTLATEIGDLYTRGLSAQMNTDLDRRMQGEAANIANRAGAISAYGELAPIADTMRFSDAGRQIDLGAAQRGEAQTELQSNIDRNSQQNRAQLDALNWYNNLIGGLSSGGSTTTTAPQGSAISGILGGAATGAGIGSLLGPWGAPIGGLLGGIGGAFA